jgi:hypothetical protein
MPSEQLIDLLDKRAKWPEPTCPIPEWEDLEEWFLDSVCEATDGCIVEHDGTCEHGHPSWFLYLDLI